MGKCKNNIKIFKINFGIKKFLDKKVNSNNMQEKGGVENARKL